MGPRTGLGQRHSAMNPSPAVAIPVCLWWSRESRPRIPVHAPCSVSRSRGAAPTTSRPARPARRRAAETFAARIRASAMRTSHGLSRTTRLAETRVHRISRARTTRPRWPRLRSRTSRSSRFTSRAPAISARSSSAGHRDAMIHDRGDSKGLRDFISASVRPSFPNNRTD